MSPYQLKYAILLCFAVTFLLFLRFQNDSTFGLTMMFGKEMNMSLRDTRRFKNIIVHLDLKGAPPRVEYLEKWFKLLKEHSVDGVLVEYEDMFPYFGEIRNIRRDVHYSKEDVMRINQAAYENQLEIIPLVQTFGHLEFLLKNPAYQYLSESQFQTNTICVSEEKAIRLVEMMLRQIRELHPNSTRIHIGADEAYHVAEDERCLTRMKNTRITKSSLKLEHISRIGKFAKELGYQTVFAWNDMFDKEGIETIRESKLQDYIVPVVWGYAEDVTRFGYFPEGLLDRISDVFDDFYLASAFKGANGIDQEFLNVSRYLENHKSYEKLMDQNAGAEKKLKGIFVTGWSRFSHNEKLCELLPVAIPSLVMDLNYLNFGERGKMNDGVLWENMKSSLHCEKKEEFGNILVEWTLKECSFPGVGVFNTITNDWKNLFNRRKSAILKKDHINDEADQKEAVEILEKLRVDLLPILFEKDVDEVVEQYLKKFMMLKNIEIS